jgi:hypothetical protein
VTEEFLTVQDNGDADGLGWGGHGVRSQLLSSVKKTPEENQGTYWHIS